LPAGSQIADGISTNSCVYYTNRIMGISGFQQGIDQADVAIAKSSVFSAGASTVAIRDGVANEKQFVFGVDKHIFLTFLAVETHRRTSNSPSNPWLESGPIQTLKRPGSTT
jgi:hypothetical protein